MGSDSATVAWRHVRDSRLELVATLESLGPGAWDTPSSCERWRVRDVVGHVVGIAEGAFTLRRVLLGLLRHKGRVDDFLYDDGCRRGTASSTELVDRLRRAAGAQVLPAGRKPGDVLTDVIVHTQDIARPLGLDVHANADALRVALRHATSTRRPYLSRRTRRLRLAATDLDAHWGRGPIVQGRAEDLLLAVCGRRAVLDRLSGDGVSALAAP